MDNGFNAGALPFFAWENYGTIRGTSTPAFKVEPRQHLMWNHSKVRPISTRLPRLLICQQSEKSSTD